jgi:hypothetical protein
MNFKNFQEMMGKRFVTDIAENNTCGKTDILIKSNFDLQDLPDLQEFKEHLDNIEEEIILI